MRVSENRGGKPPFPTLKLWGLPERIGIASPGKPPFPNLKLWGLPESLGSQAGASPPFPTLKLWGLPERIGIASRALQLPCTCKDKSIMVQCQSSDIEAAVHDSDRGRRGAHRAFATFARSQKNLEKRLIVFRGN
jgi:hypothetical protein